MANFAHGAGKFLEIARFGKVAIDAGKADIGDAVDLAQRVHDRFTDPFGRHFAFAQRFDLALDAGNQLVEPFLIDPPFSAGERDRLFDLGAIERKLVEIHGAYRSLGQSHLCSLIRSFAMIRGYLSVTEIRLIHVRDAECRLPVPRDHPVASIMGPPRAHLCRLTR